jgi:hypothetical protein
MRDVPDGFPIRGPCRLSRPTILGTLATVKSIAFELTRPGPSVKTVIAAPEALA